MGELLFFAFRALRGKMRSVRHREKVNLQYGNRSNTQQGDLTVCLLLLATWAT